MRLTRSGPFSRPPPVPTMPPGLVELIEGLTREVLKHNPPDVYEFCTAHMEQLLLIRDGRAPYQRLTVEKKIQKAQEKVRMRAEQRRRKYDDEIKEIREQNNIRLIEGKKTEEVKQNSNTNEAETPIYNELKMLEENVKESKLRAPVHHEKELAEALEVEIFRKPVEESLAVTATEAKTDAEEIENSQEKVKELDSAKLDTESKSAESEENTALVQDSIMSDQFEKDGISASIKDLSKNAKEGFAEHVRVRRDIDSETKNGGTIVPADNEGKNSSENTIEVVEDSSGQKVVMEDVEIVSDNDTTTPVSSDETDNKVATVDIENIDKASIFANEVCAVVRTPETGEIDDDSLKLNEDTKMSHEENEGAAVLENNDTTTLYEEGGGIKDLNEENTVNLIDNSNIQHNNNEEPTKGIKPSEEKNEIQSDMSEDIDNTSHKCIDAKPVEPTLDSNEQSVDITDVAKVESISIESLQETDNKATEDINNTNMQSPNNIGDIYTDEGINETKFIKRKISTCGEDVKDVDYKSVEHNNFPETQNDTVAKGDETVEENNGADLAVETVNLIGNAISVENNETSKDSDQSTEKNNDFKSEKNKATNGNENPSEEHKVNPESKAEGETSEAMTTVDKVLVEDSGSIKDDNDAAPTEVLENGMNEVNYHSEHLNGTQEVANEDALESRSETPEPIINFSIEPLNAMLMSEEKMDDKIKNVENLLETQDYLSTSSEPLKTETSSLDKSSSMDDMADIIEEGIVNIKEVDVIKPSYESLENKEDANAMDLETAAVTIQKVFRSFLFKRSTFDETSVEGANSMDDDIEKVELNFPVTSAPLNKERRALGISRMDTVLQTVNEEKSLSLSTDDSSLSSAATIIQAHVRGFLVRNRLNSNKTNSASVNSEGASTSLEADAEQKANKTILNIHIVPEGQHFLSRDESLLTSMELSYDGSPPSSTNLHPLGYDKSERRKLIREDAIQSISPPSNNSGKLSEDVDSVKDMLGSDEQQKIIDSLTNEAPQDSGQDSRDDTPTKSTTIETVIEAHKFSKDKPSSPEPEKPEQEAREKRKKSLTKFNSDESDVVTPYEEKGSIDSDSTLGLLHSGEFHDVVLPTKVSRADTSVVREFKNVLVYFLLWNN